MPSHIPSYRYHKARQCAVVTIAGKDHYLGRYDSPESRERYHRLVAEWLATVSPAPAAGQPAPAPLTVDELILRYWQFARTYYVKHGAPTSEQDTLRQALRFVRRLYGSASVDGFTPLKLKAVRQAMIEHGWCRRYELDTYR